MAVSDLPIRAVSPRPFQGQKSHPTTPDGQVKGTTVAPGAPIARRDALNASSNQARGPGQKSAAKLEDRYGRDVLAVGAQPRSPRVSVMVGEPGIVVECATSGWCGEIICWERTSSGWAVVLEDRHGARRLFPPEPAAFLHDGILVTLTRPKPPTAARQPAKTASGSLATSPNRAKVARASRIWVEGRHDAELVERVWGCDLREIGVVVEELGGIDELQDRIRAFQPAAHRRLVVLVDHLVAGSKEWRIAESVERLWAPHVRVLGHPYVDVWQAVTPRALGIRAWPEVPKGQSWKDGVCRALGWPADTSAAWRRILGCVGDYTDLEPALLGRVEEAIDLVTADH